MAKLKWWSGWECCTLRQRWRVPGSAASGLGLLGAVAVIGLAPIAGLGCILGLLLSSGLGLGLGIHRQSSVKLFLVHCLSHAWL
ncbi:hypothetical protein BO99DRAFT_398415 [Aspergillus violaceofuscus CBS 115571]|uniref:Uncharacterized protein n=1 Tax=Aspergillus violaceofuscus (strain CBS 115571) TaxID=1450538 RepID=A0A2V5HQE6_ASPV1|nr:hypothetical protein BO99DRAFT_398415 [Aspergillus violaceofuscus CBS 115571]